MNQLNNAWDVDEIYDEKTGKWIIIWTNTSKISNDQISYVSENQELREKNFISKPSNPDFIKLWEARISTLEWIESVLDFDLSLLDSLSKFSNSVFPIWKWENEKIVISSDILSLISENIKIDIHKYINNSAFKRKLIEVLKLRGNYSFFIERTDLGILNNNDDELNQSGIFPDSDTRNIKFSLILIPMNLDQNRWETTYKNAWISKYYLEYICNNLLNLDTKEKKISFVKEISDKINLSHLSKNELSTYFSSWNYLNFLFEKIMKEIFILSNWYIDKEISIWLAWYILRVDFDMEFGELEDFFNIISKLIKFPEQDNEIVYIDLEDVKKIIESKNISIQKYISNPLFKQKIRETLKLSKNYWFVIYESKSKILMIPIDDWVRRYSWLKKENANFIISNILNLDTKEKKILLLDSIISTIDLTKLSEKDLALRFSSWNYINYVFTELVKYVFNYSKWNLDLDMAKWVAGALFREDFDFVNSSIAWSFRETFSSKLALKLSKAYRIDEDLEQKFKSSVYDLEDLLRKNLWVLPNDIEVNNFRKSFSNEIYTNFSRNIKNSFSYFWIENIDENIIKWLFIYCINKWEINNPMNWFTDLIFSKITTKTRELSKLFAFFDWKVIWIWKEEYTYPNFNFRDIEIKDEDYSVDKIFNIIKEKLERYDELWPKIASISRSYNEANRLLELTNNGVEKINAQIVEIQEELIEVQSLLDNLNNTIPSWLKAILGKKKHLKDIENTQEELKELNSLLAKKKNDLIKLEEEKNVYLTRIKSDNSKDEVAKLEEEKNLLEEQIRRIKEDFSNTLFYWLRQDKK